MTAILTIDNRKQYRIRKKHNRHYPGANCEHITPKYVLLRENGGKLEVYLTKRAAYDPAYPGQYHCPGSYMRPGESYADVFERLNEREFKTRITKGRLVGIHNNTNEERGHTQSHIFLVEVESEPQAKNGGWF